MTKSSDWDPYEVPVTFIRTAAELHSLDEALVSASRVAVDTETHAAQVFRDGTWAALRVIAVAITRQDGSYEAFTVDVRDIPVPDLARTMSLVGVADAWNANFDDRVLAAHGCPVREWRDAMFTDGVLHSGITGFEFWHSLAHSARKFLGVELSGKGTTQTSYDGESDLSDEQVTYPAIDALITLRLAQKLDETAERQGLSVAVELEQKARPFILEMMERGLPFDQAAWARDALSVHQAGKHAALVELADLTGGPEETLFGTSAGPSWNPDSDAPTREALNTFAREAVLAYTGGRLLERTDKLDKTTLKQVKHPIAKALLKYREHAKVVSTYGENLDKYIAEDGRIRPRYKQGGVVATGRLASDSPNAQNFSPKMKPYFRPPAHHLPDGTVVPRAFVYADLSQAELRVLAQVSGEERMREQFKLGGDFHTRTAADMFQVDMEALKETDPTAFSNNRKKAKGVSFGIPYGLGANALATNLTVNSGLETTQEEASEMLKKYGEAYPSVKKWLDARDSYVRGLSRDPGPVDWARTFEVFDVFRRIDGPRKTFKRQNKRLPSLDETVEMLETPDQMRERLAAELEREPSAEEVDAEFARVRALVAWVLTFDAPVLLAPGDRLWFFASKSPTGRRRLFTVPVDSSVKDKFEGLLTSCTLNMCTYQDPQLSPVVEKFAAEFGIDLPPQLPREPRGQSPADRARSFAARGKTRAAIVKAFEGDKKPLKYELLKFVRRELNASRPGLGDELISGRLLPEALGDQVRSLGNKYRNHPIQSLVADVGLQYYADLRQRLAKYRNAFPVQAVHDSIAIECDLEEAFAVCAEVKESLQAALACWCPDVPAVADADVRLSLDDDSVIAESEVAGMLEEWPEAAPEPALA